MDWFGAEENELTENQRHRKEQQMIKDTDTAVFELVRQAEVKVHQRIVQKFDLMLIDTQVKRYLMPQLQNRIETFKSQLMAYNKQMQ